MLTFEEDFKAAVAYHGHSCAGIVLGVRLGRLGLRLLGIDEPQNYRDLIVYVEIDRCITDAVGTVTHCTPGRRRLKLVDYGKMAAAFVDLGNNRAVRVTAADNAPRPAQGDDPLLFWRDVSDEQLFKWERVSINIAPENMPGKAVRIVTCDLCGEKIHDGRELNIASRPLCRACVQGAYHQRLID